MTLLESGHSGVFVCSQHIFFNQKFNIIFKMSDPDLWKIMLKDEVLAYLIGDLVDGEPPATPPVIPTDE